MVKKENRVGFREKVALGVGALPAFMGGALVKSLGTSVYQMILGVNPVMLGIAFAIPSVWDAFTDPLMGKISDNYHSRYGRRKPFIVLGAILMGLTFGFIWMVPESWPDLGKTIYLIVTSLVFYTCFTIYMVPFQSLMLEMTPDYDERTRVMGYNGFFGKIGEFIYQWIFPLTQMAVFASVLVGVRVVGWGVSILIFAGLGIIPGLFVKERYYKKAEKQKKVKFFDAVKGVFGNRGFVVLILLTGLMVIAGMFASSLDYYLLVYYVFDGDLAVGSVWKGILSSTYAVVGITSIWFVSWLSAKCGKRAALSAIFTMVIVGGFVKWFLFVPGNTWVICLDAILCGPIWTATGVLQPSMLADVCDDDELKHGQRREGMFGSLFSWVQKVGFSLSFLGTGVVLQLAGFDEQLGGAQSDRTILIMRGVLVLITSLTAVIAIGVLAFYPISRKRALEIRTELEARRGEV